MHLLSAAWLQVLYTDGQYSQRLLGRHEVPVHVNKMSHRFYVHRLRLSFELSLVSIIFVLEGGSDQLFRHLRRELYGANEPLLTHFLETPNERVYNLVLVLIIDGVHLEMKETRRPYPGLGAFRSDNITDLLESNPSNVDGLRFKVI